MLVRPAAAGTDAHVIGFGERSMTPPVPWTSTLTVPVVVLPLVTVKSNFARPE